MGATPSAGVPEASTGRVETVIEDDVVAAVAAHAAATTAGVVRLEASVGGLIADLGRVARHRLAGITPAPSAGTTVINTPDGMDVHVSVTVTGDRQASAVAAAVQRAVAQAVAANTGLRVAAVHVSIVDVTMTDMGLRRDETAVGEVPDADGARRTTTDAPARSIDTACATAAVAERSRSAVVAAVISAVRRVPGLRPASPLLNRRPGWWAWDPAALAVEVTDTRVEVRLAALRLPLTPLLDQAAAAIREATARTRWAFVSHRLVVAAVDARAFTPPARGTASLR